MTTRGRPAAGVRLGSGWRNARSSANSQGRCSSRSTATKVTGQSYSSYVRQHVFKPAGMTRTSVSPYTPARVPGMAHGYMLIGPNCQPLSPGAPPSPGVGSQAASLRDNSTRPQIANPSGGAYSTVGDLLMFAHALLHHKPLTPAMTNTVLASRVSSPQPGGPSVDKDTYGFAYQAINGVTFIGHNGGTPGYGGQIDIYPNTGYIIVLLTNPDQVMLPAIQRSEAILTRSVECCATSPRNASGSDRSRRST